MKRCVCGGGNHLASSSQSGKCQTQSLPGRDFILIVIIGPLCTGWSRGPSRCVQDDAIHHARLSLAVAVYLFGPPTAATQHPMKWTFRRPPPPAPATNATNQPNQPFINYLLPVFSRVPIENRDPKQESEKFASTEQAEPSRGDNCPVRLKSMN